MTSRITGLSWVDPQIQRSDSLETYMVRIFPGDLSQLAEFISVEAQKSTTAAEIVSVAAQKLRLGNSNDLELAETFCSGGQLCKERRIDPHEYPVCIQLLWPKTNILHIAEAHRTEYRFFLRKKEFRRSLGSWVEYPDPNPVDNFLSTFLQQPKDKEYPDLCNLPDLNENTLLDSLRSRFSNGHIYTYVGSILISVNPFKFYPIYNPRYVKMYQKKRLNELPPHIFAIADAAYHRMLDKKSNQCIVISGESGSGKTESTNLLLHHLSALSQRAIAGTGIEQTILGAGPVLEAFGNAKTVHNNNSSRFGKFIQVNYKENGTVHGAIVEKYLLEKSRIVHQAKNERNYHVFYYLLAGASEDDRAAWMLTNAKDYRYLSQSDCYTLEGLDGLTVDDTHEFARLQHSMEMVGFTIEIRRRIFSVLSVVLHLGNVRFRKTVNHRHHDSVVINNMDAVTIISSLLKVKQETLVDALTRKHTMAGGEKVVMSYNLEQAVSTRDAIAKCLYEALFNWIVLQINQALISKKEIYEHQGNSIGVLDIFGFENFNHNSFEQFCINYANEKLHYYFNQHIFKFEQEEYVREGIQWKNIEYIDNTACLDLFAKRPAGLLYLLDEESNFPGASNSTLLDKFKLLHQNNGYFEIPATKQTFFTVCHYAGKVNYSILDFREKNLDLMRPDILAIFKNSSLGFIRQLVGIDPVAMLRWAIMRAFFRAVYAFIDAGKRHRKGTKGTQAAMRKQIQRASLTSLPSEMSEPLAPPPGFADDDDDELFIQPTKTGPDNNIRYANTKLIRRASRVIMKSRSFKPKANPRTTFCDLKSLKTVTGRTLLSQRSNHGKSPSVSAQFNQSLSKLMENLRQGNPFFVRCIKSNDDKIPLKFDSALVLRQLEYTGMLATVKIRQSGYNYRLPIEDFIQQYKILLQHGLDSTREDVSFFLQQFDMNADNYQIGKTKVFLRETDKLLLDDTLHQAIMRRITTIQNWAKGCLERRRYIRMRLAILILQCHVRRFLARRRVQKMRRQRQAALDIQRVYRGHRVRLELCQQHQAATILQKYCRRHLARIKSTQCT